jgi:DNA-binding transcriptional ArsR family regulator
MIKQNGDGIKPVVYTNGFNHHDNHHDDGQPEKLRVYVPTPDPLGYQEASEVKRPEPEQPTKKERHFKPFTLAELALRPSKQWLVKNLFGRGDLGMDYGLPGHGKTFEALDLIMATCSGQRFAGRFDVTRKLNVAYCASEGLDGLPQRVMAAAAHHQVPDDCPNFAFFEIVPQLFDGNSPDSIALFVAEWQEAQEAGEAQPLDLMVIDTQHGATVGADENSSTHMGHCLHAAKAAIKALGCAVMLIHHSNRAGTGERGSGAMRGAMDFMIECKKVSEGKFSMHCAKLKDGAAWEAQGFTLVPVSGFTAPRVEWTGPLAQAGSKPSADGRKSETRIKILEELYKNEGCRLKRMDIAEAIGMKPAAVGNVAKRLAAEGLIDDCQDEYGILVHSITTAGIKALQDEDEPI